MSFRRVITGHDSSGAAIFLADEQVESIGAGGFSYEPIWATDNAPIVPNDGSIPKHPVFFPVPGGSRVITWVAQPEGAAAPEATPEELDAAAPGLFGHMEADEPGMHTTQTIDIDIVMSGEIGGADRRYVDAEIDTIEQRPRQLALVVNAAARGATAGPARFHERSVLCQLAQHHKVLQALARQNAHGGEKGERNRQVVVAAFLGQISRRQIDRDALRRKRQAKCPQRCPHPLAALAHRLVGKADDGEGDGPRRDHDLDVDGQDVDALESHGPHFCLHVVLPVSENNHRTN